MNFHLNVAISRLLGHFSISSEFSCLWPVLIVQDNEPSIHCSSHVLNWNGKCTIVNKEKSFFYTSRKSWRGYISTSVCLSVCQCVCVCLWTKFQSNECTNLNAVFAKWLLTALAQTLLKLVTWGRRSSSLWLKMYLKMIKKKKTRSIQRTQTPPRLWSLTFSCDLDL